MCSVALLIYRAFGTNIVTSITVLHVLEFAKPRSSNGVQTRTQTNRFFKGFSHNSTVSRQVCSSLIAFKYAE
jgi:hypothetical protein